MRVDPRTIPQVLDRIADQFSDHDALVTDDRRLTFAQLRDEVRTGRRGDDRPRRATPGTGSRSGRRTPGTGWWPAWPPTTRAACVVPLNTRYTAGEAADVLARTGAPLLVAAGEFLGADKTADLDRDALPELRHIVRVPIDKDDGTWDEFVARGTDLVRG